jgi:hypothetical protein
LKIDLFRPTARFEAIATVARQVTLLMPEVECHPLTQVENIYYLQDGVYSSFD